MTLANRTLVAGSLALLYTVWGSTYLAQKVAMTSLAPLQMAAARFTVAGLLLVVALRARGAPWPTSRGWRAAALSGVPLLVTGMGLAAMGLRRVPTGLAALVFGAVPLWTCLLDGPWGGRPRAAELAGLACGLAGVALVSLRGGLAAEPVGALMLVAATVSYAVGGVATRRLPLAAGAMGTASQLLVAGPLLALLSVALREPAPAPSLRALGALAYLVVFGTLAAYVALGFLLRAVRPALATSYAFVNPIVALSLGASLAGEALTRADLAGLALVLAAVGLVAWGQRRVARPRRVAALPSGADHGQITAR